jgi:hypothetical protein
VTKRFRLQAHELEELITGKGWCIASDRITVDGRHVGFMYRETPTDDGDSGWRFFAGDESDDYVNNRANLAMYDVNTIANYDPAIIPMLGSSSMSAFERPTASSRFTRVPLPEAGMD